VRHSPLLRTLSAEGFAYPREFVLEGVNDDVGVKHVFEHLERLAFLILRLFTPGHEVVGDTRSIEPGVPR
jgi:hypothetical protein